MSTPATTLPLDRTTLEAQLARAIQDRTSLEQLGNQKQKEMTEAVAKFNAELDQYRGALQYNALVIENLKKDIESIKPLQADTSAAT